MRWVIVFLSSQTETTQRKCEASCGSILKEHTSRTKFFQDNSLLSKDTPNAETFVSKKYARSLHIVEQRKTDCTYFHCLLSHFFELFGVCDPKLNKNELRWAIKKTQRKNSTAYKCVGYKPNLHNKLVFCSFAHYVLSKIIHLFRKRWKKRKNSFSHTNTKCFGTVCGILIILSQPTEWSTPKSSILSSFFSLFLLLFRWNFTHFSLWCIFKWIFRLSNEKPSSMCPPTWNVDESDVHRSSTCLTNSCHFKHLPTYWQLLSMRIPFFSPFTTFVS